MSRKCWYQEAQTQEAVGGSQLERSHLAFSHTVLCISVLFSLVLFTEHLNFAHLLLRLESTFTQVRLCLTFPRTPSQNIKPCTHGIIAVKDSGQSTKIHMCVVEEADPSRGVRGMKHIPILPTWYVHAVNFWMLLIKHIYLWYRQFSPQCHKSICSWIFPIP